MLSTRVHTDVIVRGLAELEFVLFLPLGHASPTTPPLQPLTAYVL